MLARMEYYGYMYKNIGIISLIVLLALAIGFIVGSNNDDNGSLSTPAAEVETATDVAGPATDADIKALVSYALPDGWAESTCPSSSGSVNFRPNSAPEVDCSNNPELSISLSESSENITECSQIQDVQEVRKHICKSLFINDLRSLVAETEYLASSTYGRETSVKTYYFDYGSGIVKALYASADGSSYQSGFDELVNSIRSK